MAASGTKLLASAFGPLASFSLDTTITIALVAAFSAYAFYSGRRSATAVVFALIGAHSLYTAFTYREGIVAALPAEQSFWVNVIVFGIFFIVFNVVLRDIIRDEYPSGTMKFFQSLCLGIALSGLLLAYYYHLFGGERVIHNFSSGMDVLFAGPMALFGWIAGSVLLIFFLERI